MMKKILHALLFAAYLIYSFEILIPYLDYMVNFDYIVSYLCEQKDEDVNMCMGGCYLEKEMQQQDEEKKESPSFNENYQQTLYFVHKQIIKLVPGCIKISFQIRSVQTLDNILPVKAPPPRA